MFRVLNVSLMVLTLTAVAGMSAPPAKAQSDSNTNQPVGQGDNYSKQELKTYALAALEVQEINQAYVEQLSSVQGTEAKEELRKVTMDRIIEAIRDTGITLKKYNRITVQSGDNPELSRQISRLIEEVK